MAKKQEAIQEILKTSHDIKTKEEFNLIKKRIAQKYGLSHMPKNAEILASLTKEEREPIAKLLRSKPVRTASGVAPVAIMAASIACPPQAQCTYCPGGPGSVFGNVPKSYTDGAPAVKRAIRNKYDAYFQVLNRLEHYMLLDQSPSKVELIIMGGTFPSFPKHYRDLFIAGALKAMNDFSELFYDDGVFNQEKFNDFFMLPGDKDDKERQETLLKRMEELKEKRELSVAEEQKRNETAQIRCIALVIETRPDCSYEDETNEMLRVGTTRVELGVQSLTDEAAKRTKRGHGVAETIKATQLLKDSFLKVGYHMMLGLPGATKEDDLNIGRELFTNQDFQPDALKLYPCLVMAGTELYKEYKAGKFTPITTEEAIDRLIHIKKDIPEYCRIMRIQRDIPTYMTEAGVDKTNLRQMITEKLEKAQQLCRCIRCREPHGRAVSYDHVKTNIKTFQASGGTEVFISQDDMKNDILLGYARLRIPYKPFRKEITAQSAGIRELHVFGSALNLEEKPQAKEEVQHRGVGAQLMQEAERIAQEEYDAKKMLVISGIGVREYYKKKLSYITDGPYVSKKLV